MAIIVVGMLAMAKIDPTHTDAFILFGLGILAAVGLVHTGNQLGEIKNATNGSNSRVISLLEKQSDQMARLTAAAMPAPPPVSAPPLDGGVVVDQTPIGD